MKIVEIYKSLNKKQYTREEINKLGLLTQGRINRLIEFGLMIQIHDNSYLKTLKVLTPTVAKDLHASTTMSTIERDHFYKKIGLINLNYNTSNRHQIDEDTAIRVLKEKGYRIQKAVTQWEEI